MTDFQTGMPISYSIVDNDGNTPASAVAEYTSAWITVQDPENINDTVAASTSYFTPAGTASRWMITPQLTLGGYGNFVSWEARSHDASFPDDYLVLVSTTDLALSSFTDTIGYVIEENVDWTSRSVNLSNLGYDNQSIYIAFVNVTDDGFKLYIDDIHVWKEDPVGINEISTTIMTVYPNPATDFIHINTQENIRYSKVIDLSGIVLHQTELKHIQISHFPSGVYFLEIHTDLGNYRVKFIKN